MPEVGSTAIVWFRRDLRLHDHPALTTALREHDANLAFGDGRMGVDQILLERPRA